MLKKTALSYKMLECGSYQVKLIRKRIKNLNLRINTTGAVTLSAPMQCSLDLIYRFLQEKQDWIILHRNRLQEKCPKPSLQLTTDEHHFFLGETYPLKVYEDSKQKKVIFDKQYLHLYILSNMSFTEKQSLLSAFYRQQMSQLLPDFIRKWELIIGVKIHEWGIKAMKTRWGSCNIRKKRIWLNLYLIHKPIACLEYVLVHEMVHLLEASHNKRFYKLLSEFMPNWKECKKQL